MSKGRREYQTLQLYNSQAIDITLTALKIFARCRPTSQAVTLNLALIRRALLAAVGPDSAYEEVRAALAAECFEKSEDGQLTDTIISKKKQRWDSGMQELRQTVTELRIPCVYVMEVETWNLEPRLSVEEFDSMAPLFAGDDLPASLEPNATSASA